MFPSIASNPAGFVTNVRFAWQGSWEAEVGGGGGRILDIDYLRLQNMPARSHNIYIFGQPMDVSITECIRFQVQASAIAFSRIQKTITSRALNKTTNILLASPTLVLDYILGDFSRL